MQYLKQAVIIVIVASLLGLGYNFLMPRFAKPSASAITPNFPPVYLSSANGKTSNVPAGRANLLAPPAARATAPGGIDLFSYDAAKDTQRLKKEEVIRQEEAALNKNIGSVMLEQAREMHANWTTFIDSRPTELFGAGHIQNAVNIPEATFDEAFENFRHNLQIPFDQPLVVYCGGADCALSYRIAQKLAGKGYTNIRVYKGGYDEWFAACQKNPVAFPIQ